MATEKRLIDANEYPCKNREVSYCYKNCKKFDEWLNKTVDAAPVDDIRLHHILIDNEGVPEVKFQIGDRYFILRGDPVDVRQVVHGRWIQGESVPDKDGGGNIYHCSECGDWYHNFAPNYCPNCGADMRERKEKCLQQL